VPAEVNHNWGFDKNDEDFKSPSQILFNLIDVVSKGGNYLLDVGPTALGTIPVVAQKNLETVGRWLNINGDAIYGTTRSPFLESYSGYGRKIQDAAGKISYLPFLNWRCTAKPGKLYFSIFNWPSNGFKLPSFKNEIKKVYLLHDPAKADIPIIVTNGDRIVQTQHYAPTVMANVLVVEYNGNTVEQ
jgi:alpha-L-fucosidase